MSIATRLLGGLVSDRLERSVAGTALGGAGRAVAGPSGIGRLFSGGAPTSTFHPGHVGGAVGSLSGGGSSSGSGVVGTVAAVAGVAAVGGIAYVAYNHFKGGSAQGGAAAPAPSGVPYYQPQPSAPEPAGAWPGPPGAQGASAATSNPFGAALEQQILAAGGKPLPGRAPNGSRTLDATTAESRLAKAVAAPVAAAPSPAPSASAGVVGQGPSAPVAVAPEQEAQALLLVRAMIAAAAIDGQIDPAERRAVLSAAGRAGLDGAELAALDRELAQPHRPASLLAAVDSPELAKQFYLVTLLAIDADNAAEKAYLGGLPAMLGLSAEVVQQIHQQIGYTPRG